MVINMSNGLQQSFALQMRKQLNPIVSNPLKQIIESRIERQNESGRFDTVKFSKMLNMTVEKEEEGLNFAERLELSRAIDYMKIGVEGALINAKELSKNMEMAKEGEAYYNEILSRFGSNEESILVDDSEMKFGLRDEMSAEVRELREELAGMAGVSSGIEGKSLVSRSKVEKALVNVRKALEGYRKNGINSYHTFTENGYRYGASVSVQGKFEEGALLFEKVLPKMVEHFESFLRKGAELCNMIKSGEGFESDGASRISALEDFLADLEFVEADFTPRYRLPELEEDVKTLNEGELRDSAKILVEMLKKYDAMYRKETSTTILKDFGL